MTRLFAVITSLDDLKLLAEDITSCRQQAPVVALIGNLGSGKTTFSQYVGAALGLTEPMPSPTFTLVNEYTLSHGEKLVHADLYRLHETTAIAELGLTDYFTEPQTFTLVEWADRMPTLFPHGTVTLTFETFPDHRVVCIHCDNPDFWHHLEARRLPL